MDEANNFKKMIISLDEKIVKQAWVSISYWYRVISLRCRILLSFYSEMPYTLDFILIVS